MINILIVGAGYGLHYVQNHPEFKAKLAAAYQSFKTMVKEEWEKSKKKDK